ncbi:MAG: sigma 54-interacting transcriptional regulator [Deltaproteobacteria bacterium]|nr:sigma 54-interacting transcriptional regulator [Deltaproteobacteria bacterium]
MRTPTRETLMVTGLATEATRQRTAPRSWVLKLVGPDGEVQQFSVGARPITVGAHRECDIILDDPKVSRKHAQLSAKPDGVVIRDLGSTNGTWWQGSRITEVVVANGSQIRFGATSATVSAGEAPTVPPSKRDRFGGLVGSSLPMRELFAVLELAGPTDATILIEGESGTGKEVAARAIHDHSPRADVPLVVVDCSAISEQLIESHLFGHVKGAFTGASTDRKGAFLEANGGTIFLDEIGELPLSAQTKLLRVLEAQTVQPVGSDRPVSVNTRVLAATHRDLSAMVEHKQFRFDLFYRLAVVHVHIPPLRERPGDLAPLIRHFYEGRGSDPGPVDGPNLETLQGYAWPGNVRELRNVLERAWALSGVPGGGAFRGLRLWMHASAGPARASTESPIDTNLPFKDAKEAWNDQFERRYLSEVFERFGGNITHASEHAGINRRHFRTLLRKHGIIPS